MTTTQKKLKARCSETVTHNFESLGCLRTSVAEEDGKPWCRQHLPSTAAAKQRERDRLREEEWMGEIEHRRQQEEIARKALAYDPLLAALETLVRQCESMGRASHTSDAIDKAHAAIALAKKAV